jgi:hypothetical protein
VTCLRRAEKFAILLLFLLADSVFCWFKHLFVSQDDSFLVFWYLVNVGNLIHSLYTLHQILFGGFFVAQILSLCPLILATLEKRWEIVLWWSFFTGKEYHRARSHLSNGLHHKLRDAPWQPLDLSTPRFAYYSCLVFWAPLYHYINLERLHLVFSFLFASFVLNK